VFVESIKLFGFKSFAGKAEVKLDAGITGIIGPNGCGKSNIADALRWVLGEQSTKMLRGVAMEDVIFKGSRERKPLGMAEVLLKIRNDKGRLPIEFSEVAVGRRLYKSGISEYLLNKSQCRLKDIRSLFLDSGLGVSAYAIFERQMIDDILNEHSPRRREMFEEASGIMKYKIRKREALRKLESANRDLERLSDIISEIGREVRSLSRQVGRARRYRRLKEELRDLDVATSARRYMEIEGRRTLVERELEEAHGHEVGFGAELRSGEVAVEELRIRLLEMDEALATARADLAERKAAVADQQQRSEVLSERRAGLERSIVSLSDEAEEEESLVGRLAGEITKCDRELASLRVAAEEKETERRAAEVTLAELESDLRARRERRAEIQQVTLDLREAQSEKRHELARERTRLEEASRRRERIAADRQEAELRAQSLAERIEQRSTEIREREHALTTARERLDGVEAERSEVTHSLERLVARHAEITNERAAVTSRLETLEDLRQAREGFDQGVKTLLESPPDGVLGPLADFVRVDASQALLVDAGLGHAMQSVVVRDIGVAVDCIAKLGEAGHGRVVFCPLKEMKESPPTRPSVPGKSLADIITADDEVRPVIESLLGRTFVVDDARQARSLSRENPGLTWVTPGGEVFHKDRRVSGGRGMTAARKIFERHAEIARLKEKLADVDRELERADSEKTSADERLREIDARTEELQVAIGEAETLAAESKSAVSHLELEQNLTRDELNGLSAEDAAVETERAKFEEAIAAWEAEFKETVAAGDERAGEWERLDEDIHALEARREESLRHVGDLRVASAHTSAECASAETRLARLESDKVSATRGGVDKRERIDDAREQIGLIDVERASLSETLSGAGGRISEAEGRVDVLTGQEADVKNEWAERDAALKAVREQITRAKEKVHSCDLELSELSGEASRIKDRLFDEYRTVLREERNGDGIPMVVRHERKRPLPDARTMETGSNEEPGSAPAGERGEEPGAETDGQPAGAELPHLGEELVVTDPMPADPPKRYADLSIEEWKETVKELKDALARFGPVNEMAVEEFEAKKNRLDFLTGQHDDLVSARDGLIETIRKVNQEARERFEKTFKLAQTNFTQVFETLFPGGFAELKLEGNDPLEDDIVMVARPRGKKIESIKLLSSGERALTATALLFAIYLIKPAPFCILDEVDAPLDDANIERYVALLRTFSERTQFILITHNKKTMEACDTLYGITMEEAGVSKLVSVKFVGGDLVVDGMTNTDLAAS